MGRISLLTSGAAVLFLLAAATAKEEFRIVRLNDGAALIQVGRESTTNVVALATRKGIVVIDTGVLPSRGAALRAAIEREFGRKDFAYVVNTHAHFDHVDGNQAFADVPIVAQQNAPREMARWYQSPAALEAFLHGRSRYQTRLQAELKAAPPGSPAADAIRENMAENDALMADFSQGRFIPTPPTLVFSDRLWLNLGDLSVNLVYFGRDHTDSDIIVHLPELRLLLVGDLFAKDWLPSFQSPRSDVPRWFEGLGSLSGGLNAVDTVIGGHGEPMSGGDFRARIAYLRDLWEGVAAARREDATLAATRERFPFESKYPALAAAFSGQPVHEQHLANIESAWRLQAESAARSLESLIAARGLEAGAAEYRKNVAGNERYNVVESELIALGYRYLQGGRNAEAIAVFEINAEAHPRSWNAWDSLAEGHLSGGDQDRAEKFYQKSLGLNPENRNGKNQLSQIRGARLDAAGETQMPLRFPPGAMTGRRGAYLGEKPPGRNPKIFAPGIVSTAGSMEFSIAFSPDGSEIYFTRRGEGGPNTLMVSRLEREGWTAPEEASFARGFPGNEPHITPDGRRLFFGSNRPRPGSEKPEYAIWVAERTADGKWGEPRHHGPGMYVSSARSGSLYMTDVSGLTGPDRPVVVYPWTGELFSAPQRLGGGVNAPVVADHAFVSPDESFILFDSSVRPGGQGGEGDLYVCFRKPDGSWGEAMNLGDAINTPATNFCPMLSPDGRYIFYSTCRDIYWVSAELITKPRRK